MQPSPYMQPRLDMLQRPHVQPRPDKQLGTQAPGVPSDKWPHALPLHMRLHTRLRTGLGTRLDSRVGTRFDLTGR